MKYKFLLTASLFISTALLPADRPIYTDLGPEPIRQLSLSMLDSFRQWDEETVICSRCGYVSFQQENHRAYCRFDINRPIFSPELVTKFSSELATKKRKRSSSWY